MREEIEIEKAKIEMRAKLAKAAKPSAKVSEKASAVGAKLPKFEINKFQGTCLDWIRFWNQFETEIDEAKLTQVAKFSSLKELLVPSVRSSIDGLPLTTEGYERTKTILKTSYGKSSEVGNAHMHYWATPDSWFPPNKNPCFLWETDNSHAGLWASLRRFAVSLAQHWINYLGFEQTWLDWMIIDKIEDFQN